MRSQLGRIQEKRRAYYAGRIGESAIRSGLRRLRLHSNCGRLLQQRGRLNLVTEDRRLVSSVDSQASSTTEKIQAKSSFYLKFRILFIQLNYINSFPFKLIPGATYPVYEEIAEIIQKITK